MGAFATVSQSSVAYSPTKSTGAAATKWARNSVVICLAAGAFISTGVGLDSDALLKMYKKTGPSYFKFSDHHVADRVRPSSVQSVIDAFSMSVSELSRIVGVSRQAVHDWLNGAIPSPDNLEKVNSLLLIARALREEAIEPASHILRRVVNSEGSLADRIKGDKQYDSLLARIIEVLKDEQRQRALISQRVKVDSSSAKSEDFGIPFHDHHS